MATTASAVINTTDTGSGTPTVPNATATTKWQEYIWIRHLESGNTNKAKIYVWNPNATSDATYLKWQEIGGSIAFSDLTGSATEAQLPTISYGKLNLSGAVTNSDLAGSIAADKLAGIISYSKIASVNASTVTSVSNSKIPVAAIPTMSNSDIDTVLAAASVDYAKLNVSAGDIPATAIANGITSGQITSVNATTVSSGTMNNDRLDYMFERNLPIDGIAQATGTYNFHTNLGSKPFEGIIRCVIQSSSNEVIIALPNPSLNAYCGKAAKLSIYRGSSTGKVTIKVCAIGTNSGSFATDKIVDNNNGELTSEVVVLPQLTTSKSRKVVIDLVADSEATGSNDDGDGQWIITGGAAATGVGISSQAGLAVGQGSAAPPEDGIKTTDLETTGKTTINTNNLGTNNQYAGIPKWANTAEVDTWNIDTVGSGYTTSNRIKIADTEADVTTEVEFVPTIVDSEGSTNGKLYGLKLYSAARGVFGKASGETYAERIYDLSNVVGSGSGAKIQVKLRGIQPANVAVGELWYDPWQDAVRIRKS